MRSLRFWKEWTIATRVGTVISSGIIASILLIMLGAVTFFKKEYIDTFGRQLFTTVQAFALDLDTDLNNKIQSVAAVAGIIPVAALTDPPSARKFLASQAGTLSQFDDGLMLLSPDGKFLAAISPANEENQVTDFSNHTFFKSAQETTGPSISAPFFSSRSGHRPVIEFVAPVHDPQGRTAGYLCGGMSLNGNNILGNITKRSMGVSGYFYVYARDRTILIHPDSSRMMRQDVPVGANRLFDQALQGFNGSGETVNSRGLKTIASFQHLKAIPWILAANLPLQEVLASFYTTQRRIILTIIVSGIAVLFLSWWALFRFMTPLNTFISHMQNSCDLYPAAGGPELNQLVTNFNQLILRIRSSQAELAATEELQRTLLDASPDIIILKNEEGRWLLANKAALQLFQLEGVDYKGKKDSELAVFCPPFHDILLYCEQTDQETWKMNGTLTTEEFVVKPDHTSRIFEVTKTPIFHADGRRKAIVVIARDISIRKKDEASIRKLSHAVEQSPVSIVITDTEGNIEFVNPQFSRLTGYSAEEAIGKNPRILKTECTSPEIHAQLWETISAGKVWEGEFYNQKKNGEHFIEHAIISPILDQDGKITSYMAIKEDITARKKSEEIIWWQANFDSLTHLPNRRLFLDRLQNAIMNCGREKTSLVVIFLDLDHFKVVNDSLGHDFGDLLLVEAAKRLQGCIRDTDTVSRFGGDEFVMFLTSIKLDNGIEKVTAKIIEALNIPFRLKDETVSISASIGVTICPQDSSDISTLLKNADRAMYLAKDSGRNCWRLYTDVLKRPANTANVSPRIRG